MSPKYTSADFSSTPFVSYAGASRDGDPSLLVGWAGWDHREQVQALATLIVARAGGRLGRRPAASAGRGVARDPALGTPVARRVRPRVGCLAGGHLYAGFLAETTNRLHLTDEALTSWRAPKATRGRKAKA